MKALQSKKGVCNLNREQRCVPPRYRFPLRGSKSKALSLLSLQTRTKGSVRFQTRTLSPLVTEQYGSRSQQEVSLLLPEASLRSRAHLRVRKYSLMTIMGWEKMMVMTGYSPPSISTPTWTTIKGHSHFPKGSSSWEPICSQLLAHTPLSPFANVWMRPDWQVRHWFEDVPEQVRQLESQTRQAPG